ncbi:MAG: sigma-70 family RNA polymerase sigma factor [Clostridia bacterium]|nr:sigma-70 family RNA polymerase sigma factor [Clostridia bacterium]
MAERKSWEIESKQIPQVLTPEETERYVTLCYRGNQEAKQILITRNLRLVYYIAKKFENTGYEEEDLRSIGTIGLIKGINTFEPSKGVMLATYISRCIENEIRMSLRKNRRQRYSEISMEEILYTDQEGNELKVVDLLKSSDEYKIYEKMEEVKEIFEYILNEFQDKKKLYILYHLSGYTESSIGEKFKMSQSYVSRQLSKVRKKLKDFRRIKKKCKCKKYTITIENKFYKISWAVDERKKYQLCKEIISKTNYEANYNDLKKSVSIIINAEEDAYLLLAKIVECVEDIK